MRALRAEELTPVCLSARSALTSNASIHVYRADIVLVSITLHDFLWFLHFVPCFPRCHSHFLCVFWIRVSHSIKLPLRSLSLCFSCADVNPCFWWTSWLWSVEVSWDCAPFARPLRWSLQAAWWSGCSVVSLLVSRRCTSGRCRPLLFGGLLGPCTSSVLWWAFWSLRYYKSCSYLQTMILLNIFHSKKNNTQNNEYATLNTSRFLVWRLYWVQISSGQCFWRLPSYLPFCNVYCCRSAPRALATCSSTSTRRNRHA